VNPIVKDPLQRKLEITNWVILAILFILSLIFASRNFALSVLVGGIISTANFYGMGRGLQGAFRKTADKAKGPVMFNYYIRLLLTAVVLYFLIAHGAVHVIGLIIGLSVVVMNIIITMIAALTIKKNWIEEVR
jgi:lipid-A-disaccharide synthase-like uncharacterized protein